MSEKRIEPELPIDEHNGLELATESKPVHWTEEVVLKVAKVVKYENKYCINLGLSQLNQIAINDNIVLDKLEHDISLLMEKAEQTAIKDCSDRQDIEFDICVENKKAIHSKHMGIDELQKHKKDIENKLTEKLLNKLRELRK